MSNTVHALLIGRTLARKYAIEELIGSGGMSTPATQAGEASGGDQA